jgi:hypothetical protein
MYIFRHFAKTTPLGRNIFASGAALSPERVIAMVRAKIGLAAPEKVHCK